MWYQKTENFDVWNNHEINFIVKPFMNKLYMKKWSAVLIITFISGFTFWVYVTSFPLSSISWNFALSQWGPELKNLKNAKNSFGSKTVATLNIFLISRYIIMVFVLAFIGFMLISRFFKLAVNVSVCDTNGFACFLKVFSVLIGSSFSVRILSISIL